jgi:hypothetical protein
MIILVVSVVLCLREEEAGDDLINSDAIDETTTTTDDRDMSSSVRTDIYAAIAPNKDSSAIYTAGPSIYEQLPPSVASATNHYEAPDDVFASWSVLVARSTLQQPRQTLSTTTTIPCLACVFK